jgi:hypothetical protein
VDHLTVFHFLIKDFFCFRLSKKQVGSTDQVRFTMESDMLITELSSFRVFTSALLAEKVVKWTLKGDLNAKMFVLGSWVSTPYSVAFDKEVEIPGKSENLV